MRSRYTTPDNAHIRATDFPLSLVDISYTLSKVELCILLGRDTLNLDEGLVGTAGALPPLVSKNATLAV